ncbi:ABC transporter permease, partial [Listeria monocytogenes]|nr:ABC transporter permease [Listeria monocytogenes]HEM1547745.1 ABC transporter permease [Listeria monocytogenes]
MSYLWTSIKMQFRIPVSVFFSLLFPLIMMFAMVTSYGNFDIGEGYHFVDKYFLISTGMGMLPIALISFPIWLGESVQNKSYKRLEYFGLSAQ